MRKIKVISKRAGEPARMVNVSNSLENLQRAVGGYIEAVRITSDLVVICDEDGRLKGLPYNFSLGGHSFFGDVLLAGVKGEDFSDIPMTFKEAQRFFPSLVAARPATLSHGEMVQLQVAAENRCVCCGEIIPEGRQVCPNCERREK